MFFTGRRRHTRFDCDWSSDLCSSDLVLEPLHESRHALDERARPREAARVGWACGPRHRLAGERRGLGRGGFPNDTARSIEVAPGSVVELDPRHATGERLGGLELTCDDHRAGRIDIALLAVDRD